MNERFFESQGNGAGLLKISAEISDAIRNLDRSPSGGSPPDGNPFFAGKADKNDEIQEASALQTSELPYRNSCVTLTNASAREVNIATTQSGF